MKYTFLKNSNGKNITLPSWLSLEEYESDPTKWDRFWGLGNRFSNLYQTQQRYLVDKEYSYQYVVGNLLANSIADKLIPIKIAVAYGIETSNFNDKAIKYIENAKVPFKEIIDRNGESDINFGLGCPNLLSH